MGYKRNKIRPVNEAAAQLLGRKAKRGRRPHAAPAWEHMAFEVNSPVVHPQQEAEVLFPNEDHVAEVGPVGVNLAEDLGVV